MPGCSPGVLCHVNSNLANPVGNFSKEFIQTHKLTSAILKAPLPTGELKCIGSGVLIYYNLVLTCAHCLDKVIATFPDYSENNTMVVFNEEYTAASVDSNARVIEANQLTAKLSKVIESGSSFDTDYALWLIRWVSLPVIPELLLTNRAPRITEQVLVFQHPLGEPTQVSAGEVSAINQPREQNFGTEVHAYAFYKSFAGSSGGGVFDQHGRLLGICGGATGQTNSFFIQLNKIIEKSPRLKQYLSGSLTNPTPFFVEDLPYV
jgi:hypothetical protein